MRKLYKNENVDELATVILAKISDTLLEKIRSETMNKQSEAYPVVLSVSLIIREEGIKNNTTTKRRKTAKEKKGEKTRVKRVFVTPLSNAKNISKTCQTHNRQTKKSLYYHVV